MSVDRFCEAASRLGMNVVRVPDADVARGAIREAVGDASCLVDDTMLGDLGLTTPDDPWDALAGVSQAFAASAESGTVALVHGPGAPRRTGVMPEHHVILVPGEAVRPTYQEMVDAVAALDPMPAGVQFVTGASRSGDIESAMVKGMHGPRTVTLVVID